MEITIEKNGKERTYMSRTNGEKTRTKYDLDFLDKIDEHVTFVFPKDTIAVTTSFVTGMFAKSFETLTWNQFDNKYNFICNDFVFRNLSIELKRLSDKQFYQSNKN
jgi:hypothetical protein